MNFNRNPNKMWIYYFDAGGKTIINNTLFYTFEQAQQKAIQLGRAFGEGTVHEATNETTNLVFEGPEIQVYVLRLAAAESASVNSCTNSLEFSS